MKHPRLTLTGPSTGEIYVVQSYNLCETYTYVCLIQIVSFLKFWKREKVTVIPESQISRFKASLMLPEELIYWYEKSIRSYDSAIHGERLRQQKYDTEWAKYYSKKNRTDI